MMRQKQQILFQKVRKFLAFNLKGKNFTKLILILTGILSTVWFLIRVIPKPSRAAYPCMRAAQPLASSFILYLIGISGSVFLFRKAKEHLYHSKYLLTIALTIIGLVVGTVVTIKFPDLAKANVASKLENPNTPMGTGRGIFPGRVAWVHDPGATNENLTNTYGDYWWDDKNTSQKAVDSMLVKGLMDISGATNSKIAWDSIFHYFNRTHGKGNIGYKAGEKIVIKINLNGAGNGPQNINTSPQICYSVLNELINTVGVAEGDISIGDPNINFTDETWDKCHTAFPDVRYWGKGTGRISVVIANSEPLLTSDGEVENYLPQDYIDASYMINIPVLKKHHRAGISLSSKNHFGSLTPYTGSAFHMHYSLPCPIADGQAENGDYGVYRCFVDIMGHKDLGGKTILYLIDGIWGSVNWGHPAVKWRMTPFNNDWPSSIFLSQDPVAIESVGFDFLYNEFDENHPTEGGIPDGDKGPFPHFPGVDDFLHQAADPANWPSGINYNPEGDGTILTSLGTHEHWNNAEDKKYSRNLGSGSGIELISSELQTTIQQNKLSSSGFKLLPSYPNPFNTSTTICYYLPSTAVVQLEIYNMKGQSVKTLVNSQQIAGEYKFNWDGKMSNGNSVAGCYIAKLSIRSNKRSLQLSNKMQLLR